MAKGVLTVRVDKEVKEQAEEILKELGLNVSTAVNAFLKAIVRERGIPFPLKLENPVPGTVGTHEIKRYPEELLKSLEDVENGELEELDFSRLRNTR